MIYTALTYSFPHLEPVCCSMSGSNCCFLTSIKISQEAGKVVWYSHLFKNFPQFVVIHIFKGFSIVSEAEVDVFWNSFAFSMIQQMLAIWTLVPLPFLNPDYTSGSSQFTYCWSLAWRILSITLLAHETSAIVQQFEHSLALPFTGTGMNWPFPVLWPLLSFPNLLTYWVQHFYKSSFGIFRYLNWNSITSTSFVCSDAS